MPLPTPGRLPPPPVLPDTLTLATLRAEAVRPWATGFEEVWRPGEAGARERLERFLGEALGAYAEDRDRPAVEGTSRLSPHLHWGEVSGRQAWHARCSDGKALNSVVWQVFWVALLTDLACGLGAIPVAFTKKIPTVALDSRGTSAPGTFNVSRSR